MSRYARRTDTTHAPIREALRQCGWTVWDTSRVGDDFPDLLVCAPGGKVIGIECKTATRKDGGVNPSKISAGQRRAAELWGAAYVFATTPAEAIAAVQQALLGAR